MANLSSKTLEVLSQHGISFAITTDHPEVPIQYLLIIAAVAVREGLDEYEAIKSVTINPAIICNIDERVGSIKEGKDADLVVFEGSPLDIMRKPLLVVCNGEIKNNFI